MCRMVVFSGNCSTCGEYFSWEDLCQELSCLEAKNNGIFGDCRRGIQVEEHQFDQDCNGCTEEDLADEGIDIDEEEAEEEIIKTTIHKGKEKLPEKEDTRSRKRQRTS